jgi:hypothetical protein
LEYLDSKAIEQQKGASNGTQKPDVSITIKGHLKYFPSSFLYREICKTQASFFSKQIIWKSKNQKKSLLNLVMSSLICSVSDLLEFINDFEQKEKKVGEKMETLPIEINVLIHVPFEVEV